MPRKLFDGFGNSVVAYSQAEVDSVKASFEAELEKERSRSYKLLAQIGQLKREIRKLKEEIKNAMGRN